MGILSKNTIDTWIIPHLTVGSRGFDPTVPIHEIIEAILHRLKTGCQWRELPTKQFFDGTVLTWNSVFYHFNKSSISLELFKDLTAPSLLNFVFVVLLVASCNLFSSSLFQP